VPGNAMKGVEVAWQVFPDQFAFHLEILSRLWGLGDATPSSRRLSATLHLALFWIFSMGVPDLQKDEASPLQGRAQTVI
jgi:hypothetical protein